MVVPAHTLVAPCGANGRSVVINSLFFYRILMCSVVCQFFLETVHDIRCVHYLREYNIDIFYIFVCINCSVDLSVRRSNVSCL